MFLDDNYRQSPYVSIIEPKDKDHQNKCCRDKPDNKSDNKSVSKCACSKCKDRSKQSFQNKSHNKDSDHKCACSKCSDRNKESFQDKQSCHKC